MSCLEDNYSEPLNPLMELEDIEWDEDDLWEEDLA